MVEHLAADPRRPALTFVDADGVIERQTFAQVAADAARWAHLLRGSGYQPGDRVLVLLGNVPESIAVLLGSIKSGLVTIPCPEPMSAGDVAFRARHSGASVLIADRSAEAEVDAMRGLLDAELKVLFLDEAEALLKRCRAVAPTEVTAADRYPFVLYTPGMAKEPKGVAHTHAATYAARTQAEHWLDAGPGDVVWCTAGNWWGHSIWNVLGPWSLGAEIVMHASGFDPAERLDLVEFLGVSILGQAPAEYGLMAGQDRLEALRPSRLRHAVSAGEQLDPEVMARFREAFGIAVCEGYGQAEIALLLASVPSRTSEPGSMGLPVPGHHVAVIDEGGRELPPGEEGHIALQGRPATLFDHYWGAPEETDAAFRGSWYLTGDRAMRDDDGSFWFVGHADDGTVGSEHRVGALEVESGTEEPRPGEVPRRRLEAAARDAKRLEEERARATAEQSRQEARARRQAAKDARRAEREAKRAEEAHLRAEATERARLAEAERRAEQEAAQAEAARLRAESDEHRRQETARQEAEKRDRRADKLARKADEARVLAEAQDRRRQDEARRAAEQDAKRADGPRLRAEAKERARLQEAQRRAEQEARKAEESRLRAEAKELARLEELQRRAEGEARKAETERLRAEEQQRRRSVQEEREAERDRLRRDHERLRAEVEAVRREEEEERRQAEQQPGRAAAGEVRGLRDQKRRAADEAARRVKEEAEHRRQVEATRRKLEQAELKRRRSKPRPPERTTAGSPLPEEESELGATLVERLQAYGHGGGSGDDA